MSYRRVRNYLTTTSLFDRVSVVEQAASIAPIKIINIVFFIIVSLKVNQSV